MRVSQEIGGARGGVVRGPFAIWLRNPELADQANRFGNAFRLGGKLDNRLFGKKEKAISSVRGYRMRSGCPTATR